MTHLFRLQAIVEEGSLRRAALRLNVTQPALSRSVAQIEERLGQPLLERHARGVLPTPFGEKVLTSVMRLSRQWELAEEELLSTSVDPKGKISIDAGPLWRTVVLPQLFDPLQKAHPNLEIDLTNLAQGSGVEKLLDGRIDALFGGLQFASDLPPRLVARAFTTFHDRVVAREDHPILSLRGDDGEIPVEALLDYPWLVYTADPIYEIETVHAANERLGRTPDIRITTQSLMSAINILQRSDCVSILPDAAVTNTVNPSVIALPVALGRRTAKSGVIFREEMAEWPPLVTLLDLCEAHFGGASAAVQA
ncbi:LysR family transcriptional regulator [Pelagovum pacificum]|nr:LysR family transcriptional regulator [Pelagovum pacificum]QQA42650.1 LysR family transcriptional regulator [Pelagovum pacificum]